MSEEKFGKYTLIRQLATGGMAEIWLAEQRGPGGFNKEMVIKRILPHLAEEHDMTQMFLDEARLVAMLTHPNIGQVFELGEQDGDYFIAMEFIDGLDLADLNEKIVEDGATMPIRYVLRIVRDVLRALSYAHNFTDRDGEHHEVIHRDISPQNVLVSNDGIVKLVDFGVAKTELSRHKTETGAVKGKFAYMAPEQIEGQDLDRRVDIFALGVVFYELLTGKKPFGSELKAVSRITTTDAPDPRTFRADLPESLSRIMMKALSRDREQRFETAEEMAQAIDAYAGEIGGMVNERKLSELVRGLKGLEGPMSTEQLFGQDAQGVERTPPGATSPGVLVGESGREETSQQKVETASTPADAPVGRTDTMPARGVGDEEDSGTMAPVLIGATLAVLLLGGGGGMYVVANVGAASAAEPHVSEWGHDEDVRVVFIDANAPAEVHYDGEQVGETPFHTYLSPGDYEVDLVGEDGDESVELTVEETGAIQRFHFDL